MANLDKIITSLILGLFMMGSLVILTNTEAEAESGQTLGYTRNAETNGTAALLPPCSNPCYYWITLLDKKRTIVDSSCPASAPYRIQTFRCDMFQCAAGDYYYVFTPTGTLRCTSEVIVESCPDSTCAP